MKPRIAIIGSGIVVFLQFTLFLTVGLGLWSYYQGRTFDTPDAIFPTFIVEQMPQLTDDDTRPPRSSSCTSS